jgi:hypothetical protein
MAEAAHRGLIGYRHLAKADARKPAHRHRVVEGFLHARIREIEPLLQKVHPQHHLKLLRRTAITGLRIHRRNQRAQISPRYDAVHLRQKLLPTGGLAVPLEARAQRHLLAHYRPRLYSLNLPI